MNKEILFTYTKLTEDHIEDILDINPAKQPSQGMSSGSELFGGKFLAFTHDIDAAPQRGRRLL
jgi:hypothetical protein